MTLGAEEFIPSVSESQSVNSSSSSPVSSSVPVPAPVVSLSSRALFPLPLLACPARPVSSSRRVRQAYTHTRAMYAVANDTVRALNTIYYDFPSISYVRDHFHFFEYSSAPSPTQRRLLDRILKSAADYLSVSRQSRSIAVSTGSSAGIDSSRLRLITGRSDPTSTALRVGHASSLSSAWYPGDTSPDSLFISSSHWRCSAALSLHQSHSSTSAASSSADSVDRSMSLSQALLGFDLLQYPSIDSAASVPTAYTFSSGIAKLISDCVALPSALSHVSLLSSLPDDIAAVYSSSASLLLPSSVVAQRIDDAHLRPPRVLADRHQYVELVKRMLLLGMLDLITEPACINGLFGVPKEDGQIRLILDARRANCYFVDPPHVQLPSPSQLSHLVVDQQQPFWVAKLDLSNFYHQLVLPSWMRPFFALPSLSVSELSSLLLESGLPASVAAALRAGGPLYPSCMTLPMGFSHSVFIAQCVHEHIIYSNSNISPRHNLLNLISPRLDRCVHSLYIDDCLLVAPTEAECLSAYRQIEAAYVSARLPAKKEKCQQPTTAAVTVLGVDINGISATLSLSPARHTKLIAATIQLLQKQSVTGRELAILLGGWTWVLLLSRPSLSSVKHSYRFIQRHMVHSRSLWECVRRELLVLMALSPLLHVNFRCEFSSQVIATDASSYGAGVVSTFATNALRSSLWPLASGQHSSLLDQRLGDDESVSILSSVPSQSHSYILDLCQPSVVFRQQHLPVALSSDGVASLLASCSWSTIISSHWRRRSHINSLELHSVLLALRWEISRPRSLDTRLLLLTDSSVVYYGLCKGRSSSPFLLSLYRRYAALVLASGLSVLPIWVPSASNPADAASRCTMPSSVHV